MLEPEAVWHACRILSSFGRLPIVLAGGIGFGWVWFRRRARSDAEWEGRFNISFGLRLLAGFIELVTLFVFAPSNGDFPLVAKAHPVWGSWATIVRVSAAALILWVIIWTVLEHFTYVSETLDILEANEGIAKAAARTSRVESLQTNAAVAWLAAFSLSYVWLVVICGGWVAFVVVSIVIVIFCTVLWALKEDIK